MGNVKNFLLTLQLTHPLFIMETATNGITPIPTKKSLIARLMMRTEVTVWKVLVAATITITRMFPDKKEQKHNKMINTCLCAVYKIIINVFYRLCGYYIIFFLDRVKSVLSSEIYSKVCFEFFFQDITLNAIELLLVTLYIQILIAH